MDVQFLGADGDGLDTSDEELDARPPRRQGQLLVIAATVVALVVAGVAIARHESGGHRAAGATTHPPSAGGSVAGKPGAGQPLLTLDNDVPAIVVDGAVVTVTGGALVAVDLADGRSLRRATLSGGPARYALVGDAPNHRIWLVRLAPATLLVVGYESRTFELEELAESSAHATGAAVLDGALYIGADDGVHTATVVPDRSFRRTPVLGAGAIAADPARHRLLLIDPTAAASAVRPDAARPLATAQLPFGKGEVEVAGGRIWAGGYGAKGAVLVRLDPRTLRPTMHSAIENRLGPGAIIAAAGRHSLLIRSGADNQPLWCIDAVTGDVVHHWSQVPGAVALDPAGTVVLDEVGAAPLRLAGAECS